MTQLYLIQNYLLMSREQEWQKSVFEKYWSPMEDLFEGERDRFDDFLRTYLIMRTRRAIPKRSIYREFKKMAEESGREQSLKDMHAHSRHYRRLALGGYPGGGRLDEAMRRIRAQETVVADPLLLGVLADLRRRYRRGCQGL